MPSHDHARRLVLIDDLVAVALGHLERGKHGAVCGVEHCLQLGVGAAFQNVEIEERHWGPPGGFAKPLSLRRRWRANNPALVARPGGVQRNTLAILSRDGSDGL
jgi:hypothetical protein